jgi:hypothetical protein
MPAQQPQPYVFIRRVRAAFVATRNPVSAIARYAGGRFANRPYEESSIPRQARSTTPGPHRRQDKLIAQR